MLSKLIIALASMIVIVWAYTVEGNYDEKTYVYNQVLELEEDCEKKDGFFNYEDFSCEFM